ncbi:MAG: Pr6Pr family membrane protein [Bauldia sp.]|nr:Pr6Pr family membrane protein [Bauldia sp.]
MKLYAGLAAIVGWFALGLQLILLMGKDDGQSGLMHFTNFFSYFTILSNILVATALTASKVGGSDRVAMWLRRPTVQTAAALYITVTGLVYTFILAGIWAPTGWDRVADQLLHYAMPVIFLLFWIAFVEKGTLRFRHVPLFLIFPVIYGAYSLIRGPIVDWYPYPFLDVRVHEWGGVAVNVAVMTAGFALLAALFVLLDNFLGRARRAPVGA